MDKILRILGEQNLKTAPQFGSRKVFAKTSDSEISDRQSAQAAFSSVEGEFPVSSIQEDLIWAWKNNPDLDRTDVTGFEYLPANVDEAFLEKSIELFLKKNSIFRSAFREKNGKHVQIVSNDETCSFKLPRANVEALSQEQQKEIVADSVKQINRKAYDLSRDSLYSFKLFKLNDQQSALLIWFHQLISDKYTYNSFLESLAERYDCFKTGKQIFKSESEAQYCEYSKWERENFGNLDDEIKHMWEYDYIFNGITFDADSDSFYVTGKNWPFLYQVKLDL